MPWTAACQASRSLLSPGVCSNSCPLSWWCHPTFPSFVSSFSSCPQFFPASGSFPVSQSFIPGCRICSVAKLYSTLWDPMDCRTPSFPVLHYLPEFVQTHVHWVGDAIQPSHPLLSPSPPAFNLFLHQGLFQWVSTLSGSQSIVASASASVLPVNIQGWFHLGLTCLISLLSKRLSRVFSSTTVQKHQFFGVHDSYHMIQNSSFRI